jgi:hypothetical protein
MKPLAIDLYCGLGGWTEGLLAERYHVIGFDIEQHAYGDERYPAHLLIQDVKTLHGSQFKDASLIVASPPCQEFSYMAMPWSRAKQIARALRGQDEFPEGYKGSRTIAELTALFDACFRIQREASEAAGHKIPLVVENVKGAQPWVGPAAWNFGSYYLWGDVPALMPHTIGAVKVPSMDWSKYGEPGYKAVAFNDEAIRQIAGRRTAPGNGSRFTSVEPAEGRKHHGDWFRDPSCPSRQGGQSKPRAEGRKGAGAGAEWFDQNLCSLPSKSPRRKAASAKIAKIPLALSSHIARVYRPTALASLGRQP